MDFGPKYNELKTSLSACLQSIGAENGVHETAIDGVMVMRETEPTGLVHMMYRPVLCLVLQGAKQVTVGTQTTRFHAMQSLIVSVDLPVIGKVTDASKTEPFLGLSIDIDLAEIRDLLGEIDQPGGDAHAPGKGGQPALYIENVDDVMLDCAGRILQLMQRPQAISVLYPLIRREIYFWLLSGPQGNILRRMSLPDGHTQRIARAIHKIRSDYSESLRIDQLADMAGMSVSSFHQHFKSLTGMTPLQYQKELRLREARHLMGARALSATEAAYEVGYESSSQFSREFARLFGMTPRQSMAEYRAAGAS
ncbi:AraC family transcriptional regulator [Thalassospira marina]|uniref:AraC family transcriptional regulator n=1 Tax=Thalassospira marina TaxID=2048283 RepID=A0A2N3KS01_9PROT|nr:AraC family transcriptional regulator [Thalassospira marina]PKR53359.1 AraC family transcriptional regulator [Thalassospira marina]